MFGPREVLYGKEGVWKRAVPPLVLVLVVVLVLDRAAFDYDHETDEEDDAERRDSKTRSN